MKRAIITPTYIRHFCFIKKYLQSFNKYLKNKDFPICFIIEKYEDNTFRKIIKSCEKNLNIKVFYLEDIFEKYNISESPKEILKTHGRLSFQTIKKFYGGLYSGAEEFFFLDSESMLIKPTDMNEVFDNYFKHPKFFMSAVSDRHAGYKDTFVYNYIRTAAEILDIKPEYWTVDSYEWFYKREILEDLIRDLGEPIDIVRKVIPTGRFPDLEGVLEALLYYLYIFQNNDKYNYDIYIVQDEFKKYLGTQNYNEFRRNFDNNKDLNIAGLYELCTYYINQNNLGGFLQLFNDKNIQVMRFTAPNNNYESQKKIIDNSKICILPSEQEHLFGINGTPLAYWSYENNVGKYYKKLKKHINRLYYFKIFEIFAVIYYLIKIVTKSLVSKRRGG